MGVLHVNIVHLGTGFMDTFSNMNTGNSEMLITALINETSIFPDSSIIAANSAITYINLQIIKFAHTSRRLLFLHLRL